MKKIAIALALAVGLGSLGFISTADAAKMHFGDARYKACYKKVFPQRGYGPGFLAAVDMCYKGLPW